MRGKKIILELMKMTYNGIEKLDWKKEKKRYNETVAI